MKPAVQINNVSVAFRENTALKNISLSIPEKAFFSVIGPNGAGKTTLLTIINGLGNIFRGSVSVFGEELSGLKAHKIRSKIGYVPQHLSIDVRSPVSVKEAVSIGRFGKVGILRKWNETDEAAVMAASEIVGITHLIDKPIGHLSGGEHQKVSIARALAQEPEIILLDEPTSNLDPKAQNEIVELVEKIYLTNKFTIVFVTHILSHIPSVCTDTVLLKGGKILFSGKSAEGLTEEKLSKLYDCSIRISEVQGKKHYHVGTDHV